MRWIGDQIVSRNVVERRFEAIVSSRQIPGILWTPSEVQPETPLVLLGHGAWNHKRGDYVLSMARRLVRHHGFAAVSIDGPIHGDRRDEPAENETALFKEFNQSWKRVELVEEMIEDWGAALRAAGTLAEVGHGPLAYWGLSMGTIYGLPLVAAERRIQTAVLGLMGTFGPTGERLGKDAAAIECPVLFLMQWDDELIPRNRCLDLFDQIGSRKKELHARPGRHAEISPEEFLYSERFLAKNLLP